MTEESFSIEDRIPCSDDLCVGVVGENGTCGVCNKTYTGTDPLPKGTESPPITADVNPAPQDSDTHSTDFDPEQRVCCIDDMCVGIVGESGTCGVCGKRHQ